MLDLILYKDQQVYFVKYQYRFRLPVSSFQKRRIIKRCSFYMRLKLIQVRPLFSFYTTWKHKNTTDFSMFLKDMKREH